MGTIPKDSTHFHGFQEVGEWRLLFRHCSIGSAFGRDLTAYYDGFAMEKGLYPPFLGHFSFVEISGLGLVDRFLLCMVR